MRRRDFITLLGGAAAAWPLAARAQQAGKLPTIGFLDGPAPSIESERVAAFVQRLRELAWIDGRNLAIEYRWAEGRMPGSLTTPDRPGARNGASGRVAFRKMHCVGTQKFAAQWLAYASPCQRSESKEATNPRGIRRRVGLAARAF